MSSHIFSRDFLDAVAGDFLTDTLAGDMALVDIGSDRVERLLSWPELSDLLSTRPLEPPRIRLHRNGSAVPIEDYTTTAAVAGRETTLVRPEALYAELRAGASLVLDAVDRLHPPIREAADDLIRLVRERVQVNLYLLWGESHGFATHWDDHDTFIVQVYGTKAWTVYGPGRAHPMKTDADHSHTPPDKAIWDGVLKPGQIMHVPRGWWHNVRGTGDVSLHLTFGFTRATGIDWAQWLIEKLYAEEVFRQDVPRYGSSTERHRALADRISAIAETASVEAFLAERDRHFPQRHRFSLPWPVRFDAAADTTVEFAPLIAPTLHRDAGVLTLETGGKRYRFTAAAAPVLDTLIDARTTTVGALRELCGPATDAVLSALVEQNLVLLR